MIGADSWENYECDNPATDVVICFELFWERVTQTTSPPKNQTVTQILIYF